MYVQWEKSTYTTLKEDVNGFHCQCFFFCRHSLPVLKNLLFFLFFFFIFSVFECAKYLHRFRSQFCSHLQFTDNQILEHHSNKY